MPPSTSSTGSRFMSRVSGGRHQHLSHEVRLGPALWPLAKSGVSDRGRVANPIHHDNGDVVLEVGASPLARVVDQRCQEPIGGLRQANRQHISKLSIAEEFTVTS